MPLGDHADVVLQAAAYRLGRLRGRDLRQQGLRQIGHVIQSVIGVVLTRTGFQSLSSRARVFQSGNSRPQSKRSPP
jgi:hypothetical protein